jgi:hypothetical protein
MMGEAVEIRPRDSTKVFSFVVENNDPPNVPINVSHPIDHEVKKDDLSSDSKKAVFDFATGTYSADGEQQESGNRVPEERTLTTDNAIDARLPGDWGLNLKNAAKSKAHTVDFVPAHFSERENPHTPCAHDDEEAQYQLGGTRYWNASTDVRRQKIEYVPLRPLLEPSQPSSGRRSLPKKELGAVSAGLQDAESLYIAEILARDEKLQQLQLRHKSDSLSDDAGVYQRGEIPLYEHRTGLTDNTPLTFQQRAPSHDQGHLNDTPHALPSDPLDSCFDEFWNLR